MIYATVYAMATYRKVGGKWRAEVARRGIRKSAYFATKAQAEHWVREIESGILTQRITDKTLYNALDRYQRSVSVFHKGVRWEALRIAAYKRQVPDIALSEFTPDRIAKWRDKRLEKVSTGTVRREMNLLGAILERATVEWSWIEVNPFRKVKRPPDGKAKDRIITLAEQSQFVKACRTLAEQEVSKAFQVALETGMRAGEVLKVRAYGKVGILIDTKNGDSRQVPLSVKARHLLEQPVRLTSQQLDVHFRNVRDRLKVDYTFHATRHTAATRIALEGKLTPYEMCNMFGWRNLSMALRYFNTTASDIADRL